MQPPRSVMTNTPHEEAMQRLDEALNELGKLEAYPVEKLADIVKEVGFECERCTRCCTQEYNDHVFLLEKDVERVRKIDPECTAPAPYFDFCDREGRFYVEGYALRYKDDGTCIFLKNGLCSIYEERPSICRIYPYMLHRDMDEEGNLGWRQVSGLNEHGYYHVTMDKETGMEIARQVKEYETFFLKQRIDFLKTVMRYFTDNMLRHIQRQYDLQMRKYMAGEEVEVFVYHEGKLHPHKSRIA